MKARILIALLTVAVFAAGYGARVWADHHACKVPPAPKLLGELSGQNTTAAASSPEPLPNPAKISSALQKLGPEIDKFQASVKEIDDELDAGVLALLHPDQKPLWDKMVAHRVVYRAQEEAGIPADGLLTPEQIMNLQQRPLYKLLAVVVVPLKLEWLVHDLNLDDEQQEAARKLLLVRREKFLTLLDSSPPPTLRLSRLMPLAERIGEKK
ncbi:MAG TPA: hypothetical protein VG710_04580 [Opitutus sp.]|nr:hypothetical protein [Opitutus sp.]